MTFLNLEARSMRTLLLGLTLLSLLGSAVACATEHEKRSAPPPVSQAALADVRPRVLALLGGPEGAPAAEQWRALGPEALTVLRQLASDPTELPARRARATSGMAWVDNPQADDVLKSLATDANALPLVRSSAVLALSAREGTGAVPALSPLLGDGDAEVRTAAARALGNAGGPAARTALQGRLDAETDSKVRDEIQKALAKTTN